MFVIRHLILKWIVIIKEVKNLNVMMVLEKKNLLSKATQTIVDLNILVFWFFLNLSYVTHISVYFHSYLFIYIILIDCLKIYVNSFRKTININPKNIKIIFLCFFAVWVWVDWTYPSRILFIMTHNINVTIISRF